MRAVRSVFQFKQLGTLVIPHKTRNQAQLAAKRAQETRRATLQVQLQEHVCSDRESGLLDVNDRHSPILCRLLMPSESEPTADSDAKESASDIEHSDANSESESEPDGYAEPSDGMPSTLRQGQTLPIAYRKRGANVTKGTFAVVPVPADVDPSDSMHDHPFWVVRVARITNKHHYLHFYGDKFLQNLYPLSKAGNTGI